MTFIQRIHSWCQIDDVVRKEYLFSGFFSITANKSTKELCSVQKKREGINIKMAGQVIHLASAVCLSILSVTTVSSNLLLLIAVWKDPLKCFSSPTTSFIVGISLADLVTALTTEPFFAAYYYVVYTEGRDAVNGVLQTLFTAGSNISTVAICYSFLIVLALSWAQYIAIKCPHSFKKVVTRRNAIIFNMLSLFYLLSFMSLRFVGIMDQFTFLKLSLALNTSFLSINLMVILFLLNAAFRRHLKRKRAFEQHEESSSPRSSRKTRRENLQQQFTAVAMYLAAILLLSALPHVITAQIFLYLSDELSPQANENIQIALEISDLLLFVKVCLDAFVYAWRLPTYRRTMRMLFFRRAKERNGYINGRHANRFTEVSLSPQ